MRIGKPILLFTLGGLGYVGLELLWRGRSHISMFLAGGVCFLLLGKLSRTEPPLPLWAQGILGSVAITSVELLTGLLANRDYTVWDYRDVPLNFHGQVCLPFSLLWIPLSLGAIFLYGQLDKLLSPRKS